MLVGLSSRASQKLKTAKNLKTPDVRDTIAQRRCSVGISRAAGPEKASQHVICEFNTLLVGNTCQWDGTHKYFVFPKNSVSLTRNGFHPFLPIKDSAGSTVTMLYPASFAEGISAITNHLIEFLEQICLASFTSSCSSAFCSHLSYNVIKHIENPRVLVTFCILTFLKCLLGNWK